MCTSEQTLAHLALLFPGQDKSKLVESQEKAKKTAAVMKSATEMENPHADETDQYN